MELTYHQEKKINKLYDLLITQSQNKVLFQAPTGSGKTFMTAHLIKKIFDYYELKKEKCLVLFLSLSKGKLAQQIYQKFQAYNLFQHYLIEAPSQKEEKKKSESSSFIPPLKNSLVTYIIGSQTLTLKSILIEKKEFQKFIYEAKINNYHIFLFWDEAHLGSSIGNKKYAQEIIESFYQNQNYKILFFTATPDKKLIKDQNILLNNIVHFTSQEAIKDYLIKEKPRDVLKKWKDYTDEELLEEAIKKFKDIKKAYQKQAINPAMLIQLKNKSHKEDEKQQKDLLKKYFKIITSPRHNLNYYLWLDNYKDSNLRGDKRKIQSNLTNHNSQIDVIFFKQAITEGWDIPRACMLVQLREIQSERLNQQVIGRIRRNPLKPLNEIKKPENKIFNKFYLLSNMSHDSLEWVSLELKTPLIKEKFQIIKVDQKLLNKASESKLKNFLDKNQEEIKTDLDNYLIKKIWNANKWTWKEFSSAETNISTYCINYTTDNYNSLKIKNIFQIIQLWNQKWKYNIGEKNCLWKWIQEKNFLDKYKFYEIYLYFIDFKCSDTWFKAIKKHYQGKYLKDDHQTPLFVPKEEINLKEAQILINEKKHDIEIKKDWQEFFAYDFTDPNNQKIFLDSKKEEIFCLGLFEELKNLKAQVEIITLTTKNFLPSDIYYEKVFQDSPLAKHYPDFLLRIKNKGQTYTFIIEVKDKNQDYDKEKTKELEQSYPQFAKKLENYCFVLVKVTKNGQGKFNINAWCKKQYQDLKKLQHTYLRKLFEEILELK